MSPGLVQPREELIEAIEYLARENEYLRSRLGEAHQATASFMKMAETARLYMPQDWGALEKITGLNPVI